jgi:V8-like Glu-specific endopeptidase
MKSLRFLVLVVVLLSFVVVSPVAAGKGDPQTVSITATAADQVSVEAMSPAARAAAQPLPFPPLVIQKGGKEAVGKPGFAPAGAANPAALSSAKADFPADWQLSEAEISALEDLADDPYGTSNLYTGFYSNYYSQMWTYYPWRAVGKLYFNGGYCSASVISPNNVIVTAAHCVWNSDTHSWRSGWYFVPAARSSSAPYGTFAWQQATMLTAYQTAPTTARDVAVIKLKNNSAGHSVTYYTGWLGRRWNYGYTRSLFATGYPSNLSSGYYQYICAAESFSGGTDVLGMGCKMTYGSSGGPWIDAYYPYLSGSYNYVESVVSSGNPSYPTFYGARFTSSNIVPLCSTIGC